MRLPGEFQSQIERVRVRDSLFSASDFLQRKVSNAVRENTEDDISQARNAIFVDGSFGKYIHNFDVFMFSFFVQPVRTEQFAPQVQCLMRFQFVFFVIPEVDIIWVIPPWLQLQLPEEVKGLKI